MPDDLVERLRYCAVSDNQCSECKYRGGSPDGSKMCIDLLMEDAADAIEELSRKYESIAASLNESVELVRKLQQPRWIPVSERLPEDSGDYLVHDSCGNIFQNFFGTVVKRWSARDGMITHWMPLPDPPEEEA